MNSMVHEFRARFLKAYDNKQIRQLIRLTSVFIVLAILLLFYWLLYAKHYESTDNAYVGGNVIPVTSEVAGVVQSVMVNDTEMVKEGQLLVHLDDTDRVMALDKAKENLALILRQTNQWYINDKGLIAAIDARKLSLKQADSDLKRRELAIHMGGISQEDLTHAKDTFNIAQSLLISAQAKWGANQALIAGTKITANPNVLLAITALKEAYLNYVRTTIRAPVSGLISRRVAQVGEVVNPGTRLMAIVPLDEVWVDANFKEKQLRNIKPGQRVWLTADMYGSSLVYHGRVVGLSGGTGSAFSLLPAQNATGNWIKVVQRLPVRIALLPSELKAHPLRIGLSMQVEVDTSKRQKLEVGAVQSFVSKTNIYSHLDQPAAAMARKIIQDNLMDSPHD